MPAMGFRGTAPTFARYQPYRFLPVGTQTLSALSSNCQQKAYFNSAKPSTTAPGRLKGCDNPSLDVYRFR
jgi:hypothetical protein